MPASVILQSIDEQVNGERMRIFIKLLLLLSVSASAFSQPYKVKDYDPRRYPISYRDEKSYITYGPDLFSDLSTNYYFLNSERMANIEKPKRDQATYLERKTKYDTLLTKKLGNDSDTPMDDLITLAQLRVEQEWFYRDILVAAIGIPGYTFKTPQSEAQVLRVIYEKDIEDFDERYKKFKAEFPQKLLKFKELYKKRLHKTIRTDPAEKILESIDRQMYVRIEEIKNGY